jgi:hypothetical protein
MIAPATTVHYDTPAIYEGSGTDFSRGSATTDISPVRPPNRPVSYVAGGATVYYVPLFWGERFAKLFTKLDTLLSNESLSPTGSPAPNHQAVGLARIVLERFHRIEAPPDKVVATADGGVAICFVNGNKYSDIECSNEGGLLGVTTNRRDRPAIWKLDQGLAGIDSACARIKKFIWENTRQTT